jgi:hypothetical protein
MLAAINKAEDCFTNGRYNILRVIAAYPLDAKLESRAPSKDIQSALLEDLHPLATMKHSTLLASLATSNGTPSILSLLNRNLKRVREEEDGLDKADGQPSEKSRKTF